MKRCIETNLILNYEKCHFMASHDIVSEHLDSSNGIKVDKAKVDVIYNLPYPNLLERLGPF